MRVDQEGEPEKVKAFVGWLLRRTNGCTLPRLSTRVASRCGSAGHAGNVETVVSVFDHFEVTPRQIIKIGCPGRSTS